MKKNAARRILIMVVTDLSRQEKNLLSPIGGEGKS
jgi:hypothetical protein